MSLVSQDRKNFLARISHNILREDERDVRPGLLTKTREHYPTDKARVIESKDGLTDRSYSPRECEKSGASPDFSQTGSNEGDVHI